MFLSPENGVTQGQCLVINVISNRIVKSETEEKKTEKANPSKKPITQIQKKTIQRSSKLIPSKKIVKEIQKTCVFIFL